MTRLWITSGGVRRVGRLVWGEDVDPELRPVVAVDIVGAFAMTTLFPFMGIWAVDRLGASQVELSFAFLAGALGAIGAGYLGGHLSDHVGRKRVILTGTTGLVAAPIVFAVVSGHVLLGLAAIACVSIVNSATNGAEDALVADLVPPERRERGYAAIRVAKNLGVSFGPPVGGLLLLGSAWSRLFGGVAVIAACSWFLAWRFLPARGRFTPDAPPARGSFAAVRRDRRFLAFAGAMSLAWMTYVAFDSLLAISLVRSHGVAPAAWGLIVVVNPLLVTCVQLRLTRATRNVAPALKLAFAMPLMGVPFAFLTVADSIPVVVVLVAVFVVGEMLWVPTSQAVVSAFAPDDIRGAYMGVFGSTSQVAWAITPFAGLQIRNAFGDAAMWDTIACLSLVAALVGVLATRGRDVASATV